MRYGEMAAIYAAGTEQAWEALMDERDAAEERAQREADRMADIPHAFVEGAAGVCDLCWQSIEWHKWHRGQQ